MSNAYNPNMSGLAARETWRLIQSPPARGAFNMGLDEAILESVSSGQTPPTLRLYAWDPPCLSLGYAQPASDVDRDALERLGWDWVRRPTGGRAILHTDELTYSIATPIGDPHVAGGVLESYQHLSQGLLAGLEQLGLRVQSRPGALSNPREAQKNPVCFENPGAYEITIDGRKLVGSAQVRRRLGVLQHGTLPLFGDLSRIIKVLTFDSPKASQAARARVLQQAATVEQVLGRPVEWSEAAEALAEGFASALGIELRHGDPSPTELSRADELAQTRYGAAAWTARV